jgi:hypothetical protein
MNQAIRFGGDFGAGAVLCCALLTNAAPSLAVACERKDTAGLGARRLPQAGECCHWAGHARYRGCGYENLQI